MKEFIECHKTLAKNIRRTLVNNFYQTVLSQLSTEVSCVFMLSVKEDLFEQNILYGVSKIDVNRAETALQQRRRFNFPVLFNS